MGPFGKRSSPGGGLLAAPAVGSPTVLAAMEEVGIVGTRASAAGGVPLRSLAGGSNRGTRGSSGRQRPDSGSRRAQLSTPGRPQDGDPVPCTPPWGHCCTTDVDFTGRGGYTFDTARLRRGSGGPLISLRAK